MAVIPTSKARMDKAVLPARSRVIALGATLNAAYAVEKAHCRMGNVVKVTPISVGTGYAAYLGAEGQGRWQGKTAERLGLNGPVLDKHFDALRASRDPETNEALRSRAVYKNSEGKVISRTFYDLTISPNKSVSIAALNDDRIVAAHREVVGYILSRVENHAQVRVRENGQMANRTTGELAIASFDHIASRTGDPLLHSHAILFNLTWDQQQERWAAANLHWSYKNQHALTETYRRLLSERLETLGYELQQRGTSRGKSLGFEISGIPESVVDKFSQRATETAAGIQTFIEKHHRYPSIDQIDRIKQFERGGKPWLTRHLTHKELVREQLGRLTPDERMALEIVKETAFERSLKIGSERERLDAMLERWGHHPPPSSDPLPQTKIHQAAQQSVDQFLEKRHEEQMKAHSTKSGIRAILSGTDRPAIPVRHREWEKDRSEDLGAGYGR